MDIRYLHHQQFVNIPFRLALACKLLAIASIIVAGVGFDSYAGGKGKRVYFSHSSSAPISKSTYHTQTIKRHSGKRHHRAVRKHRQYINRQNFHRGHDIAPLGPLVIKVDAALKHRRSTRIKIINHPRPNNLQRHIITSNGGVKREVYYDARQCDAGYDCVVRLGEKISSPKIIVVGEKRKLNTGQPTIIYPPL